MKRFATIFYLLSFIILGLLLSYAFIMSSGLIYVDILEKTFSGITKGYLLFLAITLICFLLFLKKHHRKLSK